QYLIREGLKAILQSDARFVIAGECASKHDTFYLLKQLQPDILIIDYNNLTDFTHGDIQLLRSVNRTVKVLIIADITNKQIAKRVIEQGVRGFLTNTCENDEILCAVCALMHGEKFYCNKVLQLIMEHPVTENSDCNATSLSEREIQIIQLVANGHTTKQIAELLYRSAHTISTHRKNIMKKLGFNTTRELLLYAIHTGLVKNNATVSSNN
ncbi:MAG: LuxR C-terminal-related transcriptional regulator, partial [Chitinophagales bacterium]